MWSATYGAVQNGLSAANMGVGSYILPGFCPGSLTKVRWKDPGHTLLYAVGRLRRLGILPVMCTRRDAFGVRGSPEYTHDLSSDLTPKASLRVHVTVRIPRRRRRPTAYNCHMAGVLPSHLGQRTRAKLRQDVASHPGIFSADRPFCTAP